MNRAALAALVLATGIVHAQPAPNAAADAALTEGRRLYDVREWDKAIAKFKEAYTLRPDAAALFNLAQSYRLKGDCANAAGFYKTYRRNFPTEKNIDKVDKFIVEMDACAKTQPAVVEPVPPPTDTTAGKQAPEPIVVVAPPPEPPRPPVRSERNGLKWTGIVMAGVGAASIGLGVKFGLDGSAAKDDLAKVCATSCTSAQALAIEDDGRSANTKAYICTAVGGALVVGGVVAFVVSRMGGSGEGESPVAFSPTAGGAMATYTVGF
jgi:tetratricopeptide (TPR) repeat protein